jgi:hypothetical protein
MTIGHQAEGLFQQGALQPVHHKAVQLAFHHNRGMTGGAQKHGGTFDDAGIRPRRGHHFRRGNQVGRIERMHHKAARASRKMFGEGRGQDGRCRAGQDGAWLRRRVEPCEQFALDLDRLGRVFLHIIGVRQSLFQLIGGAHAVAHLGGAVPVQKIQTLQVRQQPLDVTQGLAGRGRVRVP